MTKKLLDKINRAASEISKLKKAASNYVVVSSQVAEHLNNIFNKKEIRREKIRSIYGLS